MIRILSVLLFLAASIVAIPPSSMAGTLIRGAGASFPYPLYLKWARQYEKKTGVNIEYTPLGSSKGVEEIRKGRVDFAGTDAPLPDSELEKAGLIQFPMAIGGVTPVVNIDRVYSGELKLTPETLADIYLGKIKRWDDERITALNPSLKLPSAEITVVHRSDGSGTTWIFTKYLSTVSGDWLEKAGFGASVNWPAGVGRTGNRGVAELVKGRKNSIGYVEYAYALPNRLHYVRLRNKSGNFVMPFMNSFMGAASSADWAGGSDSPSMLIDQQGKDAWPIAGATFILVRKTPEDCGVARAVLEFFDWAYRKGSSTAESLVYVPIPRSVYKFMEEAWSREISCGGEPVWKNSTRAGGAGPKPD